MRAISFGRPILACAAVAGASLAACSGSSTPTAFQFSQSAFPAFVIWPPAADGAPAGENYVTGDAIITTIPFSGGGKTDVGALQNRAAFFLASAEVSPQELASLRNDPVSWSASNGVASLAPAPALTPPPGSQGISLPTEYVSGGTTPGVGTLTGSLQNAPISITASAQVYTYRVVDVGCTDAGALPGVTFDATGNFASVTAGGGDLYVTGPTCANNYVDQSGAYTIHVPYGGTLLSLGPVAQANGAYLTQEGVQNYPLFTTLPPSAWKPDFTSLSEATFDADFDPPCVTTTVTPAPLPSGVSNPLPTISGCSNTPLDVLVFKTQSGAIVKMYLALAHDATTSGRNLTGAYEVTNPSGAFPY